MLYSRFLLVFYFVYSSVYMSVPISQFIPPPSPCNMMYFMQCLQSRSVWSFEVGSYWGESEGLQTNFLSFQGYSILLHILSSCTYHMEVLVLLSRAFMTAFKVWRWPSIQSSSSHSFFSLQPTPLPHADNSWDIVKHHSLNIPHTFRLPCLMASGPKFQ